MRKNNCEIIRRELDELMLGEASSAAVTEHLKECAACREFQQTQTKLRQMVGSLGTVAAPADFDFRLRARLANDAGGNGFYYWSFARRGVAFAAVLVVFATGMIVVRNIVNQETRPPVVVENNPPVPRESPEIKPAESNVQDPPKQLAVAGQENKRQIVKNLAPIAPRIKRPLSTIDRASTGAEVLSGPEAVGSRATAVIPIDASLPSLRFSLDDGYGNERTISVPTIRFGSQRMLPNANQFAQKGIW